MEQIKNENVTKPIKKMSNYTAIRVSKTVQKKLTSLLTKANKKDYGKRVKADALIGIALEQITDNHIKSLQQESLSNADLLEMKYREHVKQNGKISKDEFYGLLLKQMNKSVA